MTSAVVRALQCTLPAAYGAKLRVIFSSISPACATGRSKMRILTCTFNPRHSYGAKREGEVQVFFSGTLCLRCTHHVTSAPSLHSHWLFEVDCHVSCVHCSARTTSKSAGKTPSLQSHWLPDATWHIFVDPIIGICLHSETLGVWEGFPAKIF